MDIQAIYEEAGALLKGHYLLSSGNHSAYYLQSAKVLEYPEVAAKLAEGLAQIIKESGVKVDTVCSPALGGILAGYELARALGVRFIFTERVGGDMTLRRGFEIKSGENMIICEDIITTGGSAMEAAEVVEEKGGNITAFAALANRGFCRREGTKRIPDATCKLREGVPFFALADFEFPIYSPDRCPLCATHGPATKPGSRGNN